MGKKILVLFFLSLVTISQIQAEQYRDWQKCPKFSWERNWGEWAKITQDPEWAEWAKRLQSPKALALGKAWADYLGYDAVSITNRSKLAPDIVPGLVITPKNYLNYPGLRQILPPEVYKELQKGGYPKMGSITIVPTQHQYNTWGRLKWTKRYEGTCKIASDGQALLGWKIGLPFPHPKSAAEVVHSFDRITCCADQLSFNPISFVMFDRKERQERIETAWLYWRNYLGRTDIPPIPSAPEGEGAIMEKGSMVLNYPYDLKGYAGVRVRFADPKKEDSFEMYLPFLRRIRRLSGADTADPIIGTDLPWEDWKAWWQKLSPYIWPMEYSMVEEREYLCPIRWLTPYRFIGASIHEKWERRPCWVIDAIAKTPRYLYSKRRAWIDKEMFALNHINQYDIRGNLWRAYTYLFSLWDPETGELGWYGFDVVDKYNKHRTCGKMECITNDPRVSDDYFSLGWLRKLAH